MKPEAIATPADAWREIADQIDHFVWTFDGRGRIEWANPRWHAHVDSSAEPEPTIAGWLALMPPEEAERLAALFAATLIDGRPFETEHRIKRCADPESALRWVLTRALPIADADGKIGRWIGTASDIHDHKIASLRREHNLEMLAEAIPQMVWQATSEGHVEYFNARWFEYTKLSNTETLGYAWLAALHPQDIARTYAAWNEAVACEKPFETEYRIRGGADGVHRWFLARGTPIRDAYGMIVCWLGTCTDVDERRRVEAVARFASEASAELSHSVDVLGTCRVVAQLAVEFVADACVFDIMRSNGTLERVAWAHRDPRRRDRMAECVNYPARPANANPGPVARAFSRAEVQFVRVWNAAYTRRTALNDDHLQFLEWLGISSFVSVPLIGANGVLGVLAMARTTAGEYYGETDLAAFGDVGRRIGQALESARALERNREVADRFQRAALPKSLPVIAGLAFDAIYEPAGGALEVGGDWYDAFSLEDGSVMLSIGDVTGHGLEAAITMNTMRQSIRTAARYDPDPARMLAVIDTAMRTETADRFVTAFIAHLTLADGRLRYASAGHPPPYVRRADGSVAMLDRTALVLGVADIAVDGSGAREIVLGPGDMLLLYTDGLIAGEHHNCATPVSIAAVIGDASVKLAASPAARIRDALLTGQRPDDVAIMVVTLEAQSSWKFDALDASAAQGARIAFARYLRRTCSDDSDVTNAETIFGELVGNVVRYAPGAIEIELEWLAGRATLHVMDKGRGFTWDAAAWPDDLAESGRGLFIVHAFAQRLEVRRLTGGGAHIVVELPVFRAAG